MSAQPLHLPIVEPTDDNGELKHYTAGSVIFREKEIGGSLHFIKSGEVEIFQTKQGNEIILANLQAGEVIGTMSLLTKERRLASARAKTDVTTLYIDSVNVDQLIDRVPFWVKTVLKDFVFRIQEMNSRYCQLKISNEKLEETLPSRLQLAKQCAIGLNIFSNYVSQQKRQLNLNECLSQLAAIMQRPISELKEVIKVFEKSGLISNRVGAPPILNQSAVEALQIFAQSVQANAAETYSAETLEKLLLISEKIASRQGKNQTADYVELQRSQLEVTQEDLNELATIPRLNLTYSPDQKIVRINSKALGALLSSFVAIEMLTKDEAQQVDNEGPLLA